MKIEIRVAWVLRYIGSSTTCTSTTSPSAGAITYCSPRGPVRDGSRKKTSSHTASRNRTTSGTHTQGDPRATQRSEEHTSELQSQSNLVCRLLLEKKKKPVYINTRTHTSTSARSTVR